MEPGTQAPFQRAEVSPEPGTTSSAATSTPTCLLVASAPPSPGIDACRARLGAEVHS